MNEDGILRAVAWSELFPWLSLFRCFRLAIRLRLLLLSAAAVVLTLSGWALFGWIFPGSPAVARQMRPCQGCPWLAATALVPDRPGLPDAALPTPGESIFERSSEPVFGSWDHLAGPLRRVFTLEASVAEVAFLLLCGLWTILVWSVLGSAITRVAAVELASGERIGWGAMMGHVREKWRSYFAAPALALSGVLFLTVLVGLGGLVLMHFSLGIVLAGILWPLALAAGLLMAMLLLGVLFGWPLMWATISAEGTDSLDALSRSYAYVFQRPLHYLFYAVVAAALGLLGWILVSNFAAGVIYLTYWAASWGAGAETVTWVGAGSPELGMLGSFGAVLIRFWCECVKLLAVGYLYSYFWTAATAIYFLLRRDVDATEMDEVFLDEQEGEAAYGLPALKADEQGAPQIDEEPAPQVEEQPEAGGELES